MKKVTVGILACTFLSFGFALARPKDATAARILNADAGAVANSTPMPSCAHPPPTLKNARQTNVSLQATGPNLDQLSISILETAPDPTTTPYVIDVVPTLSCEQTAVFVHKDGELPSQWLFGYEPTGVAYIALPVRTSGDGRCHLKTALNAFDYVMIYKEMVTEYVPKTNMNWPKLYLTYYDETNGGPRRIPGGRGHPRGAYIDSGWLIVANNDALATDCALTSPTPQ